MKITIYELLGMVKDGKAPNKIKYINSIWKYDENTKDYIHDDIWLIYSMNSIGLTEREVEIIEEQQEHKIPEKLPYYSLEKIQKAKNKDEWREERISLLEKRIDDYHNKINEILDYLEEIK